MVPANTHRKEKGFTLIELLIVIAIIAILALIAVPNFIEAQLRAKVSREQSDIRIQATALEAYFVDWNTYTRDSDSSLDTQNPGFGPQAIDMSNPMFGKAANGVIQLTTPVSYMPGLLKDPFVTIVGTTGAGAGAIGYRIASGTWSYAAADGSQNSANNDKQQADIVMKEMGPRACFAIIGVGPDGNRARCGYKCFPFMPTTDQAESNPPSTDLGKNKQAMCWTEYDPSNGVSSIGDVYRFGGSYKDGRFMLNGETVGASDRFAGATETW